MAANEEVEASVEDLRRRLRARRRVRVLARVLYALAVVALAVAATAMHNHKAHNHPPSSREHRAQGKALANTTPRLTPTTTPSPQVPARHRGAVSKALDPRCPSFDLLAFQHPVLCSGGSVIAFAFLGSQPLSESMLNGLTSSLAIVVLEHTPPLHLPSSIGQCTRCTWFFVQHGATGVLPTEVGLMTSSLFLYSTANPFVNFPTQIGLLTQLVWFEISASDVAGSIPSQLGRLSQLTRFDLSFNHLSGSIPSELFALTALIALGATTNRLSGAVPSQFGTLTTLTTIEFEYNTLSGSIPSQLGRLTALRLLYLQGNFLEGSIPSQLGLTRLRHIRLGGNRLSGTVPSQLASLSLRELSLYENQLRGSLPLALFQLPDFDWLDVRANPLSGTVPHLVGLRIGCEDTYLESVDEGVCVPPTHVPPRFVPVEWKWVVFGLSIAVLLLIATAIGFIARFLRNPVVRASNPSFSTLTLLGLALLTLSLFPYGVAMVEGGHEERTRACAGMVYLVSVGLTMVLSCIFVRNYVLLKIFITNQRLATLKISIQTLLRPVALCLVLTLLLATSVAMEIEARPEFGCVVARRSWTAFVLAAFVLGLVVATAWISYRVRSVEAAFNDTRRIAKATYTLATFGVAMFFIGLTAHEPTLQFLALSLCVLLPVTTFVLLVNVSKVRKVLREHRRLQAAAPKRTASRIKVFAARVAF